MKKDIKKQTEKTNKQFIKPLGDRVLIKEINETQEEKMTKSGIIIPVSGNEDKGAKRGEVIAVGPGRYEEGKIIPVSVKAGDTVLFSWGDKLTIDGEEFYVVRENEVMAIIK
ncbi:MAG: co-chaperone GroES [Candidatus Taylorbacteria bacterium]|nr:co-chaperone GroES [Candidatus Taylorbacteria bacterium]